MTHFPNIPEGAHRIRPLIWLANDGAGPGFVRVWADFPDGHTERIYNGEAREADDAALESELDAARAFYAEYILHYAKREPRTPFHGKPNEPITFRPDEVPKT